MYILHVPFLQQLLSTEISIQNIAFQQSSTSNYPLKDKKYLRGSTGWRGAQWERMFEQKKLYQLNLHLPLQHSPLFSVLILSLHCLFFCRYGSITFAITSLWISKSNVWTAQYSKICHSAQLHKQSKNINCICTSRQYLLALFHLLLLPLHVHTLLSISQSPTALEPATSRSSWNIENSVENSVDSKWFSLRG